MIKYICFFLIFAASVCYTQVSSITLNESSSIFVKTGGQICADFIIVNEGSQFITEDSSCVCNGASVQGSGDISLPVELLNFAVKQTADGCLLEWTTATESNNYGFQIDRENDVARVWETVAFITGNGNGSSVTNYSYVDNKFIEGCTVFYKLIQIDNNGQKRVLAENSITRTPDRFLVSGNYPNPFNPSTNLRVELPEESLLKIEVINILGQTIELLAEGGRKAGKYEFSWNASNRSSGTYIFRITAKGISQERWVTVIKKAVFVK